MSYELRHEDTLGKNLQRICRKQIEGAIAIAHGRQDCEESPVHATRKHLKKARAALRLVEKAMGRGFFRRQDRSLRDAGRLITDLRDAEVRLQTVRQLQEIARRRDGARYGELEGMLQFELENFTAAFAEWQTRALPTLEQARDAVDCWPLDKFDGKQLRCAVQRSYGFSSGGSRANAAKASQLPEQSETALASTPDCSTHQSNGAEES